MTEKALSSSAEGLPQAETVAKAKAGDHDALARIVAEYGPELKRLAAHYLGNPEVDDVIQDIWARVLRKLWQLEDDALVLPWLKTITFRVCMDHRKSRAVRLGRETAIPPEGWSALETYIADDSSSLDEILDNGELRRIVSSELDHLPGNYGLLLRMRYFHDLGYQEIADVAGMPAELVKPRLHQGKVILRSRLAKSLKGGMVRGATIKGNRSQAAYGDPEGGDRRRDDREFRGQRAVLGGHVQ